MSPRLRDTFPSWFKETPAGRQAIKEADAADVSEKKSLAAQIAAIESERAETLPGLYAAFEEATEDRIAADEIAKAARRKEINAFAAHMSKSNLLDSRQTQLEARMRQLSDEAVIDRFIGEMRTEHARLHKEVPDWAIVKVTTPSGQQVEVEISNAASIGARMVAIVRAIRAADQLRFKACDLDFELAQLRAALPAIEKPSAPPSLVERVVQKILSPRDKNAIRRGLVQPEVEVS
jgi:hypothetical protein